MKTTIKREALEINAVLDQDTDELELQYSSRTQKQFAKTLQLVRSIENQLCPTTDDHWLIGFSYPRTEEAP